MCWTLNMHVYFVLIFYYDCHWTLDMHVCFYCYFSSWLSLFSLSYFFCCTACYFQLEVDRKNPGKVGKVNDVDDNLGAPINYLLKYLINALRSTLNGRHFPDDIFKCIFLKENVWIPIKISLKFGPKGPINNIPALVQIMAWRRPGDKPLFEAMMIRFLMLICITRPQWVKCLINSSPPGLNGYHFIDDIFKCIFMTEKLYILIWISLTFIP